MILPPKPDPVARLACRLNLPLPLELVAAAAGNGCLRPGEPSSRLDRLEGLFHLLPLCVVQQALHDSSRRDRRRRDLPAHDVVWLVVALSLFRDRSIPMVWRHLHSASDAPEPDPSAFSYARRRLGAEPLRLLFQRVAVALGRPELPGSYHAAGGCSARTPG